MAHACHWSEVQTLMAKSHPGFRGLSRETLLKHGLCPGFGEHGAVDETGQAWLVVLDDYLMGSDRLTRAWTRRHAPSQRHWPDAAGRMWGEVVNQFLVVSTDEANAGRHRAWVMKHGLPAEVVYLSPLWKS
jgi:hypothetical protein